MGAAEALGGYCEYCFRRADGIVANVAVPHTEHRPTVGSQPLVTTPIALRLSMLASINFDDELGPTAREICNEATDRQLS